MPPVRSFRLFVSLCAALIGLVIAPAATAQTAVSIHDIMVVSPGIPGYTTYFLPDSYYLYSHYNAPVSVTGVVVGVESTGDFAGSVYISEFSSNSSLCSGNSNYCWDNYVASAEGMPVFNLKSVNSACAVVGATITVVGDVVEANSVVSTDITAANTPGTGLLPTSCTVLSTNGTMTQSISLGSTLNSFGGALEYTGMTTSATFYAVSPSGSSKNATTGAVTSTGQFWATLSSNTSTNNHLFRSAGIAPDEYEPVSGVTTWTGNPQRILIDTTTFGGSPVDITVGQGIVCSTGSNITVGATAGIGLIDYTLGYARLLIFPTSKCSTSGTVQAVNSATSDSTHFHVGTLDLNGLGTTDVDYATRLPKAVVAIQTNLGQPDIVSLQEVQDSTTLSALATAVNTAAGTKYVPFLTPGANAGSLNLGFLVNENTVTVKSVNALEANGSYTTTSGTTAPLWPQPPLVLQAYFVRSIGPAYPITVINELLTARTNSGDPTLGPDIRNHRAAQATDLSALVQSYESSGDNVIVAGNLNAFEFSDGYVDVTGIVKGSPAASGTVTLYEPTSTTAALTDFVASSATSRYNYIERGDAVMYEHIMASNTVLDSQTAAASLASYETAITQPHFTTDYPAATYAATTTSAAGLTPHDGLVVAFLIPNAPTTATLSPNTLNYGNVELGVSSALSTTFTNTTTFAATVTPASYTITGTNAADYAITANTCSGALAEGSACTITVTFTPSATGSRTATLTVTSDSTSDPSLGVSLIGNGINTTATLTPTTATFPNTDIGASSAPVVFTFTNTSPTVAETVGTPSVSGDYSITANTCTVSIAAGSTCTLSVVFTPTAAGSRTGTLTVPNSSTGNPTLTAALGGTGLDTTATLTPSSYGFGNVYAGGGTSPAEVFTVTNTSAVAITIKAETVSTNFTETTTCGTTLQAGATCTVSVVFAPTVSGTISGTLTVTNSTTLDPVLTSTLSGTGLPTTASLSPTSANYGNVIVGVTSATQAFTWTNTSAIALTVSKVATAGDFSVASTTCNGSVAANSSCVVNVAFTPTALLARTGTLVITSSASANGTLSATLTGTGVADVQANTSAVNFGNVDLGSTSSPQVLTITNYTNASIALTSINISGDYTYTTTCGSTIAGLSTCTVTLLFTPTALGTRTGTLVIDTNDTKYPVITVALTGNGVDFSVAISPGSGNVIAGRSVTTTATLTPLGGFSGNVTLSCTTNASGSVCAPSQSALTLSAATSFTVAISTTAQYTVVGYSGAGGRLGWLGLLGGAVLALGLLRRRRLSRFLAALLVLVLIGGVTGCGSKLPDHNEDPTYPGTYTYTLTATDGTLTHTASYSLTVTVK